MNKALQFGLLIGSIFIIWFGGWFLYEAFVLNSNYTPSAYMNILGFLLGADVLAILIIPNQISSRRKINRLRNQNTLIETEKPSQHSSSTDLSHVESMISEGFKNLSREIGDLKVAVQLAPENKPKQGTQ